jgi:hypothetical protein
MLPPHKGQYKRSHQDRPAECARIPTEIDRAAIIDKNAPLHAGSIRRTILCINGTLTTEYGVCCG